MRPETISDEELLRRIRAHEEVALQELLRRYRVALAAFSLSLLHRRDLAEEAVANVFLSIWRRRESLTVRTRVRTYLFAAVGNQSFNLRRSELPAGIIHLDDSVAQSLPDEQRADSALLYRELQHEINVLLEKMPPQRQLIFRLNRLEGRRYGEIAKTLGLAESTVQNHMVQAVKQLAQELPKLRGNMERYSTVSPFA